MGPGGLPSLQNCVSGGAPLTGGFDSHAPSPPGTAQPRKNRVTGANIGLEPIAYHVGLSAAGRTSEQSAGIPYLWPGHTASANRMCWRCPHVFVPETVIETNPELEHRAPAIGP